MNYTVFDANRNIIRPVMQIEFNADDDLVSLTDSDANMAASLENDRINILYETDHAQANFHQLCIDFGLVEQEVEANTKAQLFNAITQRAVSGNDIIIGNVKVFDKEHGLRVPIPENTILAAGNMSPGSLWTMKSWPPSFGYETLFLQAFEKTISENESIYIISTPIAADATVIEKDVFTNYLSTCAEQNDILAYDADEETGRSIILGITESYEDAEFIMTLIDEWEEHLMSSTRTSEEYYKTIVNRAVDNQDSKVKDICAVIGVNNSNVVEFVNTMYPYFNAQDSACAWGRMQRLLYHELWNVLPIGGETNA